MITPIVLVTRLDVAQWHGHRLLSRFGLVIIPFTSEYLV